MKSKRQQALQLEAELHRLNNLVRERRKQLAFLEQCPNKHCECRRLWHQVVEKKLAHQVGKIRRHVRSKVAQTTARKTTRQHSRSR